MFILSLASKLLSSGVWLLIERTVSFTIGIAGSILLARLLGPSDFGAVAMASGFFLIIGRLAAIGVGQELMRLDERQQHFGAWFSTFFWVNALLALLCMALAIGIAYLTPILSQTAQQVFGVIAIGWTASVVLSPAKDLLQKQMRFVEISILNLSLTIAGTSLSVAMAYTNWGVWALVIPQALLLFLTGSIAFVMAKPPITLQIDRGALKHLKTKALWYVGLGVTEEAYERGPDVLIGGYLGEQLLGLYKRAFNVIGMLHSQLGVVLYHLTYPIHANPNTTADQQWRLIALQTKIVVYGLLPPTVLLAVFAKNIVLFLYGEEWAPSAENIVYLLPFGVLWPWFHQWKGFCIAKGYVQYAARVDFMKLLIMLALSLIMLEPLGVIGVAFSLNISIFFAVVLLSYPIYKQNWLRIIYLFRLGSYISLSILILIYYPEYIIISIFILSIFFLFLERDEFLFLMKRRG